MRIRLDIPLKLSEIAEAVSGNKKAELKDREIEFISSDTRELCSGDLFIALYGKNFSGSDFLSEAAEIGALTISGIGSQADITVKNSKEALFCIARLYKSKLKELEYTVAITGSVGKSTTKDFLKIMLDKSFSVCATMGNLNNSYGSCFSVLSAKKDTQILILEMGMNHSGEISEMSYAFNPDIAIITNIGSAHIGNLGSMEAIAEAKLEILHGMSHGKLIVPFGEPRIAEKGGVSFSTYDRSADFYLSEKCGSISFFNGERCIFDTFFALSEKHLLECLAPAACAALIIGASVSCVRKGVESISRSSVKQKFKDIGYFTVYEDLYNASLESVVAALDFISVTKGYGKRSAFLGSVMELGNMSEQIHRQIGRRAASYDFKTLYFFGDFAASMAKGATDVGFPEEKIIIIPDRNAHDKAADEIIKNTEERELILLKGSRAMMLERLSEELRKRNDYA